MNLAHKHHSKNLKAEHNVKIGLLLLLFLPRRFDKNISLMKNVDIKISVHDALIVDNENMYYIKIDYIIFCY